MITKEISKSVKQTNVFYLTERENGTPVLGFQFNDKPRMFDIETAEGTKEVADYCADGDIITAGSGIRLIPVSGVGTEILLPSFKPDRVTLRGADFEKTYEDVYIAVSRQSFFGGEFEFLLNNELTGDDNHEILEKTDKKTAAR